MPHVQHDFPAFIQSDHCFKAWPNACNTSTQHLATLLGITCCIRLAIPVAMCSTMLDQIWKRSNFSCNVLDVVWCCARLATFTQHCWTRACVVGPLVACQGSGHINIQKLRWNCWKCYVRLASPFNTRNIIIQHVVCKWCERLARPLHLTIIRYYPM